MRVFRQVVMAPGSVRPSPGGSGRAAIKHSAHYRPTPIKNSEPDAFTITKNILQQSVIKDVATIMFIMLFSLRGCFAF